MIYLRNGLHFFGITSTLPECWLILSDSKGDSDIFFKLSMVVKYLYLQTVWLGMKSDDGNQGVVWEKGPFTRVWLGPREHKHSIPFSTNLAPFANISLTISSKKIPWQMDKNEIKSHTRCFGKIFWSESQYLTKTFWANWTKTNRDISFWILFLHNEGEHSRKTNENSRKLKLQRYKKIMCFLTSA